MQIQAETTPSKFASHLADYWEDYSEFMKAMSSWDGNSTLRGQAETLVENGVDKEVLSYLDRLRDAIVTAQENAR